VTVLDSLADAMESHLAIEALFPELPQKAIPRTALPSPALPQEEMTSATGEADEPASVRQPRQESLFPELWAGNAAFPAASSRTKKAQPQH